MTKNVAEPTPERRARNIEWRTRQLERRPPPVTRGTAIHEIKVFEDNVPVVVGDDKFIWEVPEDLDGAIIVKVAGFISTAGGGDTEVSIRLGACGGAGTDILTDKIIIESGECGSITAATQPLVILDTIATWGQHLHIDVDAAGAGAMGLGVHIIYAPADIASVVLEGAQGAPGGATDFTGPFPGGPGAGGTPGGAGSTWTTTTIYNQGDTVVNGGTYYVTTVNHTSGGTTEPGVGVNWMTVWEVLTYSEGDVVSNGGTSYVAIVDHTATTASEPGVGANWEDFWMVLVQGHEPYSGIVTMILGNSYPLDIGVKAAIPIPFDCEIVEAWLLADAAGSVVVDLWRDTYGSYPPTNADSITAAAPLTLVTANKTNDTALTGWSTTLTTGQVLMVVIESVSDLNWLSVGLRVQRP